MTANARRFLIVGAGLAAFIGLTAAASACGDGVDSVFDMDGMHGQMHGGSSRDPQAPAVSNASEVTVEIRDFDFFPRDLTVEVGTAITWVNRDSAPHDATDDDGGWGTGLLNRDDSGTVTFETPGRYEYLCTIHPYMKGTLTVEGAT